MADTITLRVQGGPMVARARSGGTVTRANAGPNVTVTSPRIMVTRAVLGIPGISPTIDTRDEQHGNSTPTWTGSLLTRIDWADGFYKTFTHDAQGRATTSTTSTGVVKTVSYDSAGRWIGTAVTP